MVSNPLKNISQLGWWHSQYMGKSKMFQTTNQNCHCPGISLPGGSSVGYIFSSKWDFCRVNPLITRDITYLLSGMIHQVLLHEISADSARWHRGFHPRWAQSCQQHLARWDDFPEFPWTNGKTMENNGKPLRSKILELWMMIYLWIMLQFRSTLFDY